MPTAQTPDARLNLNAFIQTLVALDNVVVLTDAAGGVQAVHGAADWLRTHQHPAHLLNSAPGAEQHYLDTDLLETLHPLINRTQTDGPQVETLTLPTSPHQQRCEVRTFLVETNSIGNHTGNHTDNHTDNHQEPQSLVLLALRPLSTLAEQPSTLRRVLDAMPGLIFRLDPDMNFRGFSGDSTLLLVPPEDIPGSEPAAVLEQTQLEPFKRHLQYTREHGFASLQEYTLTLNGVRRKFDARFVWAADMYLVFVHEIVGHMAVYKHLREDNNWFKAIADQAEDVIVVHDIGGRIIYANAAALSKMGEPQGLPPDANVLHYITFPDEQAARYRQRRRRSGDTSTFRYEIIITNRFDGSQSSAEVHSTLLDIDGQQLVLAMGRDVTARQQAERELRRANRRNHILLNNTMDAVLMTTFSGRVLEVNPAFTEIFGIPADAIRGANIVSYLKNDMLQLGRDNDTSQRRDTATVRFETKLENTRGEMIEVEVSVYNIDIDNAPRVYYFIRDISQERATQRYLQQVALRWQALYEIDNSIIGAQRFVDVIELVLKHIPAILRADYAIIAVYDDAQATATLHQLNPRTLGIALPPQTVPFAEVLQLKHLRRGESVHVPDLDQLDSTPALRPAIDRLVALGVRSFLATPVINHGKLIASVNVGTLSRVNAFSSESRSMLRNIATSLAVAHEQLRLKQQLEDYARTLETKVQDRTAELARLNERLRQLDRMKTNFVSDVSHELRTPVNNLAMRLQLLEMDTPDQVPKHRRMLRQQVEHLSNLVEDILQLSRIDMSRSAITFKRLDLVPIVQAAIDAHRPRAALKGLELHFISEPVPKILGEPNQISQVVTNLITNALNYTEAGQVVVTVQTGENGHVELLVSDTGIGIANDEKALIFERFYRGRHVAKSDIAGTGLGLGIVAEILSLHNGEIMVEDNLPRGSCFIVRLPIIEHLH